MEVESHELEEADRFVLQADPSSCGMVQSEREPCLRSNISMIHTDKKRVMRLNRMEDHSGYA